MSRGYEYLCDQTWAITETGLKKVLAVAARVDLKDFVDAKKTQADTEELQNPNNSKMVNAIQIIDVIGPIVKHGDMFSSISGARSLSGIKREFISALENDEVAGILFNVDSPGGEAGGISEFSELVYNARGVKPMITYVGDMSASAAYWISSATDKIIANETASLGSIGCAAVIKDTEERDEKEGIKTIKFVSSNSPNKRPDVNTDEGKSLIQDQVNTIADIFIEKVARNRTTDTRKLKFKDVVNKFNKGGILIGKDAVEVGLADELGSFESALASLSGVIANNTKEITSMKEEIKAETNKEVVAEAPVTMETSKEQAPKTVSIEAFEAQVAKNADLAAAVDILKKSLQETAESNRELAQQALAIKADSVANSLKDRITPATKETFVKDYILRANDDKANPIEGYSRVDALVKVYEELPKHNLTEETMVLDNPKDVVDETEAYKAMAEDFAARNKTVHAKN